MKPSGTARMKHARWTLFLVQMAGIGIGFFLMYWGIRFVPLGHPHGFPGLLSMFGAFTCLGSSIVAAVSWAFRPAIWAKLILTGAAFVFASGVLAYLSEFVLGYSNLGVFLGVFISLCGILPAVAGWTFRPKRWAGFLLSIGKTTAALGGAVIVLSLAWEWL